METKRLHLATLAVLLGSAALVGCKQQEAPAPMPATPAAPAAAMPTPAATASVTGVDLGNALGPDMRVATPMGTFTPNDTIHATVYTATSDPAATVPGKLAIRWSHIDSQQTFHQEHRDLVFSGDTVTDFQISKPDGWQTGRYRVELLLDGNVVQTREFEVR